MARISLNFKFKPGFSSLTTPRKCNYLFVNAMIPGMVH